jgi:hypothetical protein
MITKIFNFFTIWNIILLLFYEYSNKYFDLLLLSLNVFLIGSYFSFIEPTYYKILLYKNSSIIISGWTRFIVADVIFHSLPLLYIIYKNKTIESKFYKTINSLLLLLFYLLINSIKEVYMVENKIIIFLSIIINLIYLMMIKI